MYENKIFAHGRFHFYDHHLWCEDVPLAEVAAAYGTPLYVYSQGAILGQAQTVLSHIPQNALVCFAVKANGNPAILRLLAAAGLGADVTSGGELFLATHAGFPPEKIIYSGVGKLRHEIEAALEWQIRALHVESAMELDLVAAIGKERKQIVPVGIRVNPHIQVETHPYISTGASQHKFGVSPETAVSLFHLAAQHPWLKPVGIAAHIGSQITSPTPFGATAIFLAGMADELASGGIRLEYIDVGGGFGVAYEQKKWQAIGAENTQATIKAWVEAVSAPVESAGYTLIMEPGRSIVAEAGVLLTQVVYTKAQGQKHFAIVDAAMNDLLRPALYGAYHELLPVKKRGPSFEEQVIYDVVGPICETGDFLAKERPLPPMNPGELLAITHAGAYGFAMSSNYNGRLRPAEILVDGHDIQLIRSRQTYDHLLYDAA